MIIPGHCGEAQLELLDELRQDGTRSYTDCLDWSLGYLDIYDQVYAAARTGAELVDMMFEHYGDVKPVDFAVHWQARLLFPKSSPDWLAPLPGEPGHIFLNPDGGYDGDPPKE